MTTLAGFNANDYEPNTMPAPLPEGEYVVIIVKSDNKPTKAKDGSFLELGIKVVQQGPYEVRSLTDRLNLDNPNPQAVEIAKRQLGDICRAVGKLTPQDSAELHNIPLIARVAVKPPQNGYSASNEIKGYKGLTAAPSTPAASAAPAAASAPAAAARGGAPWARPR